MKNETDRQGCRWTRREAIKATGATLLLKAMPGPLLRSARGQGSESRDRGAVQGHPRACLVGAQVLADGGNAVDAIVAAGVPGTLAGLQLVLDRYGSRLLSPAPTRRSTWG